jgi:2-iminobutanoate/2-iminopropanoate deaminase
MSLRSWMTRSGWALLVSLPFSLHCGSPIERINTSEAPAVYDVSHPVDYLKNIKKSQAICFNLEQAEKLVFVSGQIELDPQTGKLLQTEIQTATARTLDNVEAILKAAGSGWNYVTRVDIFLTSWSDWEGMNEEYGKRFPNGIFPARQTVVAKLGNRIEISCIAIVPTEE